MRLLLPRQQPFHALAEFPRHAKEYLRPDLALSFFISGELALADANITREFRLVLVESTQLPEPPAYRLPIHPRLFR